MQNDDGSYNTYFTRNTTSGQDYYPGEAMLALMKLYQSTGGDKYINSVEKAFPYYRSYWRNNKNTAFVPWHSQVYYLLYNETKDSELARFVFEINDWLIDNYQIQDDAYPDKTGGFPKQNPRNSASSYMEGINAAYSLAVAVNDQVHIDKYYNSIRIGARFILQMQFTDNNSFYLENSIRAVGGFKESLTTNDQRNDYTQHAVMALMKIYKNNIFD
jgi:rhamnogalacturonyl hydrolase YesR